MMWYWGSDMQWWGWLLGFLGMLVFWAFVIWAIWFLLTNLNRRQEQVAGRSPSDARRILDERLAKGEITTDEYRHLCDVIGSEASPPSKEP